MSTHSHGDGKHLSKSVWDLTASVDLDLTGRCVWSHFPLFFFCCFSHFKNKPPSASVVFFLQRCFALKLQECFVDCKTSPDSPSARGGIRCWLNFKFWVNLSFNGFIFVESLLKTVIPCFVSGVIYVLCMCVCLTGSPRDTRRDRAYRTTRKTSKSTLFYSHFLFTQLFKNDSIKWMSCMIINISGSI